MQIIGMISDMIEEKLDNAECYIESAMKYKEERPQLAATLQRISIEEMNHVTLLHEQVVNLINEYKKEHGDLPERMMGIYDYLHKKHIEKSNHIKVLQTLFK